MLEAFSQMDIKKSEEKEELPLTLEKKRKTMNSRHISITKQLQHIFNYRKGIQSLKEFENAEHTLEKYIFIK